MSKTNYMYYSENMFKRIIEDNGIEINGYQKTILAHKGEDYREPFDEHIKKTKKVFGYILDKDRVLKDLYRSVKEEYELNYEFNEFKDILQEMVEFHDLGKINPKYQIDRLNNSEFSDIDIPTENHITHKHSLVSAILFSIHLAKERDIKENPILLILPHIIHGHHTRLRSLFEENTDYGVASVLSDQKYSELEPTLLYIFDDLLDDKENLVKLLQEVISLYDDFFSNLGEGSSEISILYNYLYSVLIKSDSIATNYDDSSLEALENKIDNYYRRIDDVLLSSMSKSFEKKQKEYREKEDENPLNPHRFEMYQEAIGSLQEGLDENNSVFYLQMPTGGGKTNTLLGLALKILNNTETDRIIYSLPYISLLEQNFDYFKKVLNLKTEDMRSIYSFSEIPEESEKEILTFDDFFEYPFICTTNVSLLESITKFDKSNKYRFGALTNSIIILDEVQTLPVEYWPEFNYLLNEIADNLNSYILITSATIPGLEQLKTSREMKNTYEEQCHYLISNPETYYEKLERNRIVSEELEKIEINQQEDIEGLVKYAFETSKKEFEEDNNHGLIVVNTVRTSKNLYERLKKRFEEKGLKTECLLLNSTILPTQKRNIVGKINGMDENKRILLISTQSVEAGLDVSFDFVVRDFSILESIEQVRGRCNRNREITEGHVYLTEIASNKSEASKVYPEWRLKETKKILDSSGYSYGFDDMEEYFDNTIQTINGEIKEEFGLDATDNIECWNKMKFEENNSPKNKHKKVFHVDVIEGNRNNYSFFIETSLDKDNFEPKELKFMENELHLQVGESIDGRDLMDMYKYERNRNREDYTEKKIIRKHFSSIMSKFTVSAILPTNEKELKSIFEKVGPYFLIPNHLIGDELHHIYSVKKGFNKEYFEKENNII